MTNMTPVRYRVVGRRVDAPDVVSLDLEPCGPPLAAWSPGQFTMVYAFGVGEVPVSVSGGSDGRIVHTIRSVGAVTAALCTAPVGSVLGLRGPFGRGWRLPGAGDLVIVGGGIGLAPLRPLVLAAVAERDRFGSVDLLIGARTPKDLLFTDEYAAWQAAGIAVRLTVDQAASPWAGRVGVVTALLPEVAADPARTAAYLCGPEVMMSVVGRAMTDAGVAARRIQLSLERNMRCGYGVCGHCQLGPMIICRDGPVTEYAAAEPLMAVSEL